MTLFLNIWPRPGYFLDRVTAHLCLSDDPADPLSALPCQLEPGICRSEEGSSPLTLPRLPSHVKTSTGSDANGPRCEMAPLPIPVDEVSGQLMVVAADEPFPRQPPILQGSQIREQSPMRLKRTHHKVRTGCITCRYAVSFLSILLSLLLYYRRRRVKCKFSFLRRSNYVPPHLVDQHSR